MKNLPEFTYSRIVFLLITGMLIGSIQGCGSISSAKMIPESFDIQQRFDNSVTVEVDRTHANEHYKDFVEDGMFRTALEGSITKSGLFSTLTVPENANYLLRVEITSVGNFWGLTAKISLNTTWTLTDRRSNADVWKDVVRSVGITTFSEEIGGYARVKKTYERVIKENILLGFSLLSDSEVVLE